MSKTSNSKTQEKHIRIPHSLIKQIESVMAVQKTSNFSAWVVDACRLKILAVRKETQK
ncbi:YlcI/YnfO family protein [Tatumella citrea]|uniref:YlcI/YnfO family protein n=1 Tax=Tatumella citrea TaxID=53336 RepID=UPI000B3BF662|nr:YlcI/YnfO family protein [Tatumella citrea]